MNNKARCERTPLFVAKMVSIRAWWHQRVFFFSGGSISAQMTRPLIEHETMFLVKGIESVRVRMYSAKGLVVCNHPFAVLVF